jgi:hypothetical protein
VAAGCEWHGSRGLVFTAPPLPESEPVAIRGARQFRQHAQQRRLRQHRHISPCRMHQPLCPAALLSAISKEGRCALPATGSALPPAWTWRGYPALAILGLRFPFPFPSCLLLSCSLLIAPLITTDLRSTIIDARTNQQAQLLLPRDAYEFPCAKCSSSQSQCASGKYSKDLEQSCRRSAGSYCSFWDAVMISSSCSDARSLQVFLCCLFGWKRNSRSNRRASGLSAPAPFIAPAKDDLGKCHFVCLPPAHSRQQVHRLL